MANENSFKLKSKKGNSYQDLFPATIPPAIEGIDNWLMAYYRDILDVSSFQGKTQIITRTNISSNTIKLMKNSSFEVYLDSGEQSDYDTISQIELKFYETERKIEYVITRLFAYPQKDITINIVFFFKAGEVYGD